MNIDVDQIAATMIGAAREAVGDRWPQMRAIAETEFRLLAASLAEVGKLVAEGKIDEKRAQQHAQFHQIAARSVLVTTQGLGILAAEQALTAGVRSVAKIINGALKFALL